MHVVERVDLSGINSRGLLSISSSWARKFFVYSSVQSSGNSLIAVETGGLKADGSIGKNPGSEKVLILSECNKFAALFGLSHPFGC